MFKVSGLLSAVLLATLAIGYSEALFNCNVELKKSKDEKTIRIQTPNYKSSMAFIELGDNSDWTAHVLNGQELIGVNNNGNFSSEIVDQNDKRVKDMRNVTLSGLNVAFVDHSVYSVGKEPKNYAIHFIGPRRKVVMDEAKTEMLSFDIPGRQFAHIFTLNREFVIFVTGQCQVLVYPLDYLTNDMVKWVKFTQEEAQLTTRFF